MDVFTGDKAHADEFMQQWQLFVAANNIEERFTDYKTVLLFLTYIKGPKVDDWVRRFFQWNKTQIEGGVDENDPRLIEEMKEAFRNRFGDSQEELRAQQVLQEGIVMKGYDMDTYVAQFEELVRKAGYSYQELRVIDLFTSGIEGTLYEMCIDMEKPKMYQEWRASLERVLAIRRKLEACRPELSRLSPPFNTPSLSPVDGECSEDDDEESLTEERTLEWLEKPKIEDPEEGQSWPAEALEYADSPDEVKEEEYVESPQEEDYQESFDFEVEDELELAQENAEQNAKTPDEAVEYIQKPSKHRRKQKKVRINEWTEEYVPPDEAREQYVPEDLAPARTPSRWEQQVQHARQELTTAQMQGPSTWALQIPPRSHGSKRKGEGTMRRKLPKDGAHRGGHRPAAGVLPLLPTWTRMSTMPEQRTATCKEEPWANDDAWRGDNMQDAKTRRTTCGKTADKCTTCGKTADKCTTCGKTADSATSCDDSLSLDSRGTTGGQKTTGLEDLVGSGEDSEGSCLVL